MCFISSSAALCPPTAGTAGTVCNNGPYCCTSCNEGCTSKPQPGCSCPCQQCSTCSCCKRVERHLCRLICNQCEKLHLMLDFKDRHGKAHTHNLDRNFTGESLTGGRNFYTTHPANSTFLAFYKPSDPMIVHFSRSYAVHKWVVFAIFGAYPLFIFSVWVTGMLMSCCGQNTRIEKVVIMNWVLWLGIMWPFAILLPILQLGYPTPHEKMQLVIGIAVIACIGWLPLSLLCCYDSFISSIQWANYWPV